MGHKFYLLRLCDILHLLRLFLRGHFGFLGRAHLRQGLLSPIAVSLGKSFRLSRLLLCGNGFVSFTHDVGLGQLQGLLCLDRLVPFNLGHLLGLGGLLPFFGLRGLRCQCFLLCGNGFVSFTHDVGLGQLQGLLCLDRLVPFNLGHLLGLGGLLPFFGLRGLRCQCFLLGGNGFVSFTHDVGLGLFQGVARSDRLVPFNLGPFLGFSGLLLCGNGLVSLTHDIGLGEFQALLRFDGLLLLGDRAIALYLRAEVSPGRDDHDQQGGCRRGPACDPRSLVLPDHLRNRQLHALGQFFRAFQVLLADRVPLAFGLHCRDFRPRESQLAAVERGLRVSFPHFAQTHNG